MKYHLFEDKHRLAKRPESTLRWVEADSPEAAIIAWMQQQPRHRWRPTSALVIPEDRLYGRPTFLENPDDRYFVYADPTVEPTDIAAENRFVGEAVEFYGFQLCGMGWVKREGQHLATIWKGKDGWNWEIGRSGICAAYAAGGNASSIAAWSSMASYINGIYGRDVYNARCKDTAAMLRLTAQLCVIVDGRALSWAPTRSGQEWMHPQEPDHVSTMIYPFRGVWRWRVEGTAGVAPVFSSEDAADPLLAEKDWRRWLNKRAGWSDDDPSPFAKAGVLPTQVGPGKPVAWTLAAPPAARSDPDPEEDPSFDPDHHLRERCHGCPEKWASHHDEHMIPLCDDCWDLLEEQQPEQEPEKQDDAEDPPALTNDNQE